MDKRKIYLIILLGILLISILLILTKLKIKPSENVDKIINEQNDEMPSNVIMIINEY